MRKASQDGGDSSSITSGLEIDLKRPIAGILKSKRSSLKKKVQSFSHESDDGVVEPLLQKDKEKTENVNQSAKFLMSMKKTDSMSDKEDDKDKLLSDIKVEIPSMTSVPGITDGYPFRVHANGIKDSQITKSYASAAPIHNHMHTNVFAAHDTSKSVPAPRSQILVEIDGSRQKSYSPSPLIFTTAKIHTDGNTKTLEPVQVTSVPILSTIEGSVVKTVPAKENICVKNGVGSFIKDNIPGSKSPNDATSIPKDIVTTTTTSNVTSFSGMVLKNVTSTAPMEISENATKKITPATTSQILQPSNIADIKTNKVTSSQDNVTTEITPIKIIEHSRLKDTLVSTSVPQTSYTVSSEIPKPMVTENAFIAKTNIPSISSSADITKKEYSAKPLTPATFVVDVNVSREIEMDINKNIQTVSSSGSEKHNATASGNPKAVADISNKDKTTRNASNSVNNKPSQSHLSKADTKDSHIKTSNFSKESKDLVEKLSFEKDKMQTAATVAKQTDAELSKTDKNVLITPKTNANTVIDNSTSSTKTTASSELETKTSSSTPKVVKTSVKLAITEAKSITTNTDPLTIASKPVSVSTMKASSRATTTVSATKPITTKTVTTTANNLVKTQSTTNTKPVVSGSISKNTKPSTVSATKSSSASNQGTTAKPSVVSVKMITPGITNVRPTTNSSATSMLFKTSTVTTMKASTTKTPPTTKPVHTKSDTPSAGAMNTTKTSIKQIDPKHDDDKSKA